MQHSLHLNEDERAEGAAAFRLLSAAFRFSPLTADAQRLMDIVHNRMLATIWPFGEAERLEAINAHMAEDLDPPRLREAYERLFIGPNAFEAPAWGSVYLDKESILFGDSTRELRAFLAKEGATLNTGENEPEDHIGLLLWLASDFLLTGEYDSLAELLECHVLPWSGRYLDLLSTHAGHPFYQGLAELAALTLDGIGQAMTLSRAAKHLYR